MVDSKTAADSIRKLLEDRSPGWDHRALYGMAKILGGDEPGHVERALEVIANLIEVAADDHLR